MRAQVQLFGSGGDWLPQGGGGGGISHSLLTSGADETDAQTYNTASVGPAADALLILAVSNFVISGTPGTYGASGNGLTWVEIVTDGVMPPDGLNRLTLFRAMGASPSSGQVQISITGTTNRGCCWSLHQFTGVNTGGTNGSAAIVQSKSNNFSGDDPNSLTITFDSALADAVNNAVFAAFASDTTSTNNAATPGTGYSELSELTGTGSEDMNLETQLKIPGTTTPNVGWAGAFFDSCGIAIEIDAA